MTAVYYSDALVVYFTLPIIINSNRYQKYFKAQQKYVGTEVLAVKFDNFCEDLTIKA